MLSIEEVDEVREAMEWLCWASVVMALAVAITYVIFKRRYPHALLLCFAVCSALLPAFLLLSFLPGGPEHVQKNYYLCQFQGIGIQFWGSAIVWWWFCIGCNLYLIVVREVRSTKRYFRYFHLITWSLALIQTAIPFFAKRIGPSGFWCWIKDDYYNAWYDGAQIPSLFMYYNLRAFACFYGIMAALSLCGLIFWCRVMWRMASYQLSGSILQGYLVRHMLFVLLFIVVFIIMVTHRIYQAIHDNSYVFGLVMAHASVLSGQGIVVFICFGLTKDNGKLWFDLFKKGCIRLKSLGRPAEKEDIIGFSDDEATPDSMPVNS